MTREPATRYASELELARKAALEAGAILSRHWEMRDFAVRSKAPNQPVTDADLEADRAIKRILHEAFPGYGWLSEETADDQARLRCDLVWIVDPLDGTKEFIDRVPEFSVSIALADRGDAVVGVIYNPIRNELYGAARGAGVYLGAQPVHVTRTQIMGQARVLASRSEVKRGEWRDFDGVFEVSAMGSVAYKLALVAAGAADATFTRQPKSEWDIAAGAALVDEAGGCMTDLDGQPLRFNRSDVRIGGAIASNSVLHKELVQLAHRRRQQR